MKEEILKAVKKAYPELKISLEDIELEHPAAEEHGDYSTNIAFKLAKQLSENPWEIAKKIVACLQPKQGSNPCKVAKPGFINFWLSQEDLIKGLKITKNKKVNKTVVIDYSAPNIAKRFSIGHLRSTIIGQVLYNMYKFLGYKVIGDNHLGDWGTQFGKILYMIKEKNLKDFTVEKLEEIYVEFHQKEDPVLEEKARGWFKKLEDGDKEARFLWQKCVTVSLAEFNKIYDLLGIKIDFAYGESFYEAKMREVIKDAEKVSKTSDGAKIIEIPGIKSPLILIKSDGATTYATRDLATLKFRKEQWDPDIIVYEVGSEQTLHFQQIFAAARMLGYIKPETELIHTKHGLYRWQEGKFSTRKGNTIKLEEILDEAIKRAKSKAVGIGAIKYFDLKHNVQNDIVFDWEKMFALEGDSGPYLQYTYARARSVLRKFQIQNQKPKINSNNQNLKNSNLEFIWNFDFGTLSLTNEEIAILRYLYRFPEVVEQAAKQYAPNLICSYLFELAKRFNNFYNNCPILENPFRLTLTASCADVLKTGLNLLGIEALEKM